MAGEIGDGIEVAAAITDENIPLQAEGNTQQLREFDKVFIRLRKGNNQLIAGDYELQRPKGYFMNYFKKLQGATFSNSIKLNDKSSITNSASAAVARGQFTRNPPLLSKKATKVPISFVEHKEKPLLLYWLAPRRFGSTMN